MIQVTQIEKARTDTEATLSARIRSRGCALDGLRLWLRYPPEFYEYLSSSADPWIAMLLWPAMSLGRNLHVDAVASSRVVEAAPTLMAIMHCWDARLKPVEVRPEATSCDQNAGRAVASFFSGGVDSFYTALKNTAPEIPARARITHLISVRGLDIRLYDEALWMRVRSRLRDAAAQIGCTWVECSTNVRDVVPEELVGWFMYYGAALAGMGLGVQGLWNTVFFPAGLTYAEMYASGSHPLLDPLWSTESIRMVNDGAEATRVEKIASRIAHSEVALEHLRVCWRNPDGRYNCGLCEKCIRTMVSLQIAGVLDRCRSFDYPLDYRRISRVTLASTAQRASMIQNYEAAQAAGVDPLLILALKRCVDPSLAWRLWRAVDQRARRAVREFDRVLLAGRLRARYYRTRTLAAGRMTSPAPGTCTKHA